MQAKARNDFLDLLEFEQLPNGVFVVTTSCLDIDCLSRLPRAIEYRGLVYGRTGWNSDRHVAYYRSDANLATILGG